MAIKEAFQGQDDYTWDDFGLVDRSWDEWFADKWEPGGVFQIRSTTTPNVGVGSTVLSSAVFSTVFAGGFLATGASNISSSFTTDFAFDRIRRGESSITSNFATITNANALFLGGSDITGAFTPEVDAKSVFEPTANLISQFAVNVTTQRSVLLEPETFSAIFKMLFIRVADPLHTVTPNAETRVLKAFEETRTAKVDPITKIIEVPQETMQTVVLDENRTLTPIQETRVHAVYRDSFDIEVPRESRLITIKSNSEVNSIRQETITISVEPETRVIVIKRPPVKDSESVPRVLGD